MIEKKIPNEKNSKNSRKIKTTVKFIGFVDSENKSNYNINKILSPTMDVVVLENLKFVPIEVEDVEENMENLRISQITINSKMRNNKPKINKNFYFKNVLNTLSKNVCSKFKCFPITDNLFDMINNISEKKQIIVLLCYI